MATQTKTNWTEKIQEGNLTIHDENVVSSQGQGIWLFASFDSLISTWSFLSELGARSLDSVRTSRLCGTAAQLKPRQPKFRRSSVKPFWSASFEDREWFTTSTAQCRTLAIRLNSKLTTDSWDFAAKTNRRWFLWTTSEFKVFLKLSLDQLVTMSSYGIITKNYGKNLLSSLIE